MNILNRLYQRVWNIGSEPPAAEITTDQIAEEYIDVLIEKSELTTRNNTLSYDRTNRVAGTALSTLIAFVAGGLALYSGAEAHTQATGVLHAVESAGGSAVIAQTARDLEAATWFSILAAGGTVAGILGIANAVRLTGNNFQSGLEKTLAQQELDAFLKSEKYQRLPEPMKKITYLRFKEEPEPEEKVEGKTAKE